MKRCGSATGLVATLWAVHEMPPSETLDCHPLVLAAICTVTYQRELRMRSQGDANSDQTSWDRMHAAMGNG